MRNGNVRYVFTQWSFDLKLDNSTRTVKPVASEKASHTRGDAKTLIDDSQTRDHSAVGGV
ncbi:1381_t:CDS:2 [Funneliformis mosseae]|uniref:1381_t:CDS:1 n=1 Tax=Funneliformis mosseae TaxID=27381 RepID=A0A9N9BN36_FUNMO|nr:1381_t:CDS:2 [Funneliformis mosseae]